MNSVFILLLFWSYASTLCSQSVDWRKTGNWKLYDANTHQVFAIKSDSLSQLKSIDADSSKVKNFMTKAKQLHKAADAAWMGAYLVSYQLADGKPRKLIVSTYGGFMFDECTKTFWELPAFLRDDWREYWEELTGRMRHNR